MQKELIEKANEIIGLIEKNEKAIEELSKYAESGGTLWFQRHGGAKWQSVNIQMMYARI